MGAFYTTGAIIKLLLQSKVLILLVIIIKRHIKWGTGESFSCHWFCQPPQHIFKVQEEAELHHDGWWHPANSMTTTDWRWASQFHKRERDIGIHNKDSSCPLVAASVAGVVLLEVAAASAFCCFLLAAACCCLLLLLQQCCLLLLLLAAACCLLLLADFAVDAESVLVLMMMMQLQCCQSWLSQSARPSQPVNPKDDAAGLRCRQLRHPAAAGQVVATLTLCIYCQHVHQIIWLLDFLS